MTFDARSRRSPRSGLAGLAGLVLLAVVATASCSDPEPRPSATGPLTGVCPDPVVIQADWHPEAEHGALFHLVDHRGVEVDAERERARGRLTSQGVDMGVDIEIRSGGEAIEHRTVPYELHHDPDILMGIVVTDQAIVAHPLHPTVAVVTLLERDPMMILWDPATYDVDQVEDLPADTKISVFGPAPYLSHLVEAGIISESQIDPTNAGTPDRFAAAGGTFAQQGYATVDPYLFEHKTDAWGRPVRFQLVHDTGWEVYGGALAVRPEILDEQSRCLTELVPVIQQAIVTYHQDPAGALDRLVGAVDRFDTGWRYDAELAQVALDQQQALDLVGNGPDDTVGNFDLDRVERLLARAEQVIEVAPDLTVDDLVTNLFIDPAVGFSD